jgi:hypothetical protein
VLAIVILKQDTCRLTREPWVCALVLAIEAAVITARRVEDTSRQLPLRYTIA